MCVCACNVYLYIQSLSEGGLRITRLQLHGQQNGYEPLTEVHFQVYISHG